MGSFNPYLCGWLAQLEAAGIPVDWACRDWTRHFRLPHVVRGQRKFISPYTNLEHMVPLDIESIPLVPAPPGAPSSPTSKSGVPCSPRSTSRVAVSTNWTSTIPDEWRARVVKLANAIRPVQSEWHSLFLALAGALLTRGVSPEIVPALCEAVSSATGADSKIADRLSAARTTARRFLSGESMTGFSSLRTTWPAVAAALDEIWKELNPDFDPQELLRTLETIDESVPSWEESFPALIEAVTTAPDGVTLVAIEPGAPVEYALAHVAEQRQDKQTVSPKAKHLKAPLHSKTAISQSKHLDARALVELFETRKTPYQRLFGPLSLKNPDGTHVCAYFRNARPLVEGGQPMQWEMCKGRDIAECEHFDPCPAKEGVEGDLESRIAVGTHRLLGRLGEFAGKSGLLLVQNPTEFLETIEITDEQFEKTETCLSAFSLSYADAMHPVLDAVRLWTTELGALHEPTTIAQVVDAVLQADLLRSHAEYMGLHPDLVAAASASIHADRQGSAPPLSFLAILEARRDVKFAETLGTASYVLGALFHALTSEIHVAARIEEDKKGRRSLLLTRVRDYLNDALRREGMTVVIDENARHNLPLYTKALGYTPRLYEYPIRDCIPIERTHIPCKRATRKNWTPHGRLKLCPSLLRALTALVEWANEDPSTRTLGIVTLPGIEVALKKSLLAVEEDGKEKRQNTRDNTVLPDDVRSELSRILGNFSGKILISHYGAADHATFLCHIDALATLGDPWPKLSLVDDELAYLGQTEGRDTRIRDACRAELEKAHGVLKTATRTNWARALHIGNVKPGGTGWTKGIVRVKAGFKGRPKNRATLTQEEIGNIIVSCGGVRATARRLGCSAMMVSRVSRGMHMNEKLKEGLLGLQER